MEREYIDGGNDDLFGNNDRGVLVADKNEDTRRALQKEKDGVEKKIAQLQSAPSASPAGLKDLAAWDPYDQTASSPFFDSQWMFCVEKFDAVVGNPPYFVLKNDNPMKEIYENTYTALKSGRMNIYQCFFGRGETLINDSGVLAFIHPKTLFADAYLKATREHLLKAFGSATLVDIVDRTKVFDSVIQSVVLTLWQKRTGKWRVASVRTKEDLKDMHYCYPSKDAFITDDGKLLVVGNERIYRIVAKVKSMPALHAQFRTGSIEWNKYKTHLTSTKTKGAVRLLYGENIQRYRFAESTKRAGTTWLKGATVPILKKPAIIAQRTTSVEQEWRIYAALIDPKDFDTPIATENHINVCPLTTENSTNVFTVRNREEGLYYLALLNSKFMDFYFRLFNSNTHVSSGELNALPIPPRHSCPAIRASRPCAKGALCKGGEHRR